MNSYSTIFALGHRAVADLLKTEVLVEEKIDGSQFSFGVFLNQEGERILKCRSKGADINLFAPEGLFKRAVATVREIESLLVPGWIYRAEYLAKPKHNTLAYSRIPAKHLIIYDIDNGNQAYMLPGAKAAEARSLGLEHVPAFFSGIITDPETVRSFLETESCLGGAKIEGVVIKNYRLFGEDKKVLMGKFVSEAFKEVHAKEWKEANPNQTDVVQHLIDEYRSPARWAKAMQHLREAGKLEGSPRDIEKLMAEVPKDIEKECVEEIKEKLFNFAWPKILRGSRRGLAEWYKEELLKKQFEDPTETKEAV